MCSSYAQKKLSGQGVRLSNSWLLGLGATPTWDFLTSKSEQ